MAVEEPRFTVVLRESPFEVRDYPALVVAQVTVTGDQKAAGGKGFRLLAGYIFGGNTRRQAIAMTAPVALVPTNEKIAASAPVSQMKNGRDWIVRFTMPAKYTIATLPQPNDPRVHLQEIAPTRLAVLQFSGLAWQSDVIAKTATLEQLIAKHRLHPIGPVSLAQYDPPWTLWFLRRNEVMIPIAR